VVQPVSLLLLTPKPSPTEGRGEKEFRLPLSLLGRGGRGVRGSNGTEASSFMHVRILDLDDGVARQHRLRRHAARCVPLRGWGPRLRLAWSWGAFGRFELYLARFLGGTRDKQGPVTFIGSGDFHHVSLALLRRVACRCNLLVLDNHPDWMRRVPLLHCGTW